MLFWDVTQRRLVIGCQRLGTAYGFRIDGRSSQRRKCISCVGL